MVLMSAWIVASAVVLVSLVCSMHESVLFMCFVIFSDLHDYGGMLEQNGQDNSIPKGRKQQNILFANATRENNCC